MPNRPELGSLPMQFRHSIWNVGENRARENEREEERVWVGGKERERRVVVRQGSQKAAEAVKGLPRHPRFCLPL